MGARFLLLLSLLAIPGFGAGRNKFSCIDLYTTLNNFNALMRDLLSPTELAGIEAAFRNAPLDSTKAATQAFQIYAQALLRKLPPELAPELMSVLKRIERDPFIVGKYDGATRTITLGTNLSYRESIYDFVWLAHEFTHAAQSAYFRYFGVGSPLDAQAWVTIFHYVPYHYLRETGAMTGEWQYLRAIPQVHLDAIVAKAKADVSFGYDRFAEFKRLTENAHGSLDNHLQSERKAGRYSLKALAQDELRTLREPQEAGSPAFVASFLMGETVRRQCMSALDDPTLDRNVDWFRSGCTVFPSVRERLTATH